MWMILRGVANFLATLPLAVGGGYCLLWTIFFLLEGFRGHSFQGYSPLQLFTLGLLCAVATSMAVVFAVFLVARGRHLVHRRWEPVPKVSINPAAMKAIMKKAWIPPLALAWSIAPMYLAAWGWPEPSQFFYFGTVLLAFVPSIIAHEFLHAIGWWLAGSIPSNQIRFGVAPRQGAAFAYTHDDMPVWSYQLGALLPGVVLGILPAYGGLILHQPLLVVYGLLMIYVPAGDIYVFWRTMRFPPLASFNTSAEQDEVLRTFAMLDEPGPAQA